MSPLFIGLKDVGLKDVSLKDVVVPGQSQTSQTGGQLYNDTSPLWLVFSE